MIRLRILLEKDFGIAGVGYFPETIFVCEECNNVSTFYSIPPKICAKCNLLLPDLRQIKSNLQTRKNYHLSRAPQ